jgi:type II secretory pathway pseudopilin PulG
VRGVAPVEPGMPKRGFSILELLIVLGVVVALGAVVSANLFGLAAGARFEEAVRRIEAAFVLARADAQREGAALAMVADSGPERVALVLERFEPGSAVEGERADPAGGRASRRLVLLPAGVRVEDQLPVGTGTTDSPAVPPAEAGASRNASGRESVRMCVMLPDGGAWTSKPVYLVGPGERAARIEVNRWTGMARIEIVEAREGADPGEERELPPETGDETSEKGGQ